MNGDRFFIVKDEILWEHHARGWKEHRALGGKQIEITAPAGAIPGRGLFVAVRGLSGLNEVLFYDLVRGYWRELGSPVESLVGCNSAPGEVMYGNRVYLFGTDGKLWQLMFQPDVPTWNWFSFPHAHGRHAYGGVPPAVLADGSQFFAMAYGDVNQMWWDTPSQTWNDLSHGRPATNVHGLRAGAPMPRSSKVFVTCSDGSLRQIWWDGHARSWFWANHGQPPGARADTGPSSTTEKNLWELYWNGSAWIWFNHGNPGVPLLGSATSDVSGEKSYVLGADGNYYERSWSHAAGAWRWTNHRQPPHRHATIHLRAANGQYVCAEGGGGQRLVANRNVALQWETFRLLDPHGAPLSSGDFVTLRCADSRYVCAEGGGGREVVADRPVAGIWETFQIVRADGKDGPIASGTKIALRVHNGHYVCAEGGGGREVVADRHALGPWEQFTIEIG